jgi:hypothetical protein
LVIFQLDIFWLVVEVNVTGGNSKNEMHFSSKPNAMQRFTETLFCLRKLIIFHVLLRLFNGDEAIVQMKKVQITYRKKTKGSRVVHFMVNTRVIVP